MPSKKLTNEERLHIAIRYSNDNNLEKSIECLKALVEDEPNFIQSRFLLAAQYAEIELFTEAIKQLKEIIDQNPQWPIPHFQLGLIYYSQHDVDNAKSAWQSLDGLDDESLKAFKRGLEHTANDQIEEAVKELKQGIELNKSNHPLNKDMQRVVSNLEKTIHSEVIYEPNQLEITAGKSMFTNAYKQGYSK